MAATDFLFCVYKLISQVIQLKNELSDHLKAYNIIHSIQIEMAYIHPCCELAAKSVANLEILCSFGLLLMEMFTIYCK